MKRDNKMSRHTFLRHSLLGSSVMLAGSSFVSSFVSQGQFDSSHALKIASFAIDATPPVGSELVRVKAKRVKQPLSCRGVILLTKAQPIVLVGIDWEGIGNGGNDLWRMKLAQAAGTSPDRVAVHTLHQHDSLAFDSTLEYILLAKGQEYGGWASPFHYEVLSRAVRALKEAMKDPMLVTHVGRGSAKVKKFASTRRILGKNGKVLHERFTSTKGHPELRKYPAGLIDPYVRLVSFWKDDKPVAVLSYYATHPQSYYHEGGISCDTVGMARNKREQETGIFHLHFDGAGGNIGAGKYNDGSHKMRQILANRLATGMKKAFDATTKTPITHDQIEWRTYPAALPPKIRADKEKGKGEMTFTEGEEQKLIQWINKRLNEPNAGSNKRDEKAWLAGRLAWMHRCIRGHEVNLSCLRLGKVVMIYMPGELFVEYQLAAQKMREDLFVAMAAYGDYGPEYIGTRASYSNGGGYETGPSSRVAPEVEGVLTRGLRDLLQTKNLDITPSYFTQQKKRYS